MKGQLFIDFTDNVNDSFRYKIIGQRLGMVGKNISFSNETFFGLNPGDKVNQIGNGKNNGTIRTDLFKDSLIYCGAIICQFPESEKMYAFEVPEKHNDENIYLLYGSTGSEIFTEAVNSHKDRITQRPSSYMRFYAPAFNLIKESEK